MEIIKCGIDLLVIEYKKILAMIMIFTLVLLLIMSTIMIRVSSNYAKEELDNIFENGIEKKAKIEVDESIFDNAEILKEINKIAGVECFGTMVSYSIYEDCFKEFENLQSEYVDYDAYVGGTEILCMNPPLFSLCGLKLDRGKAYEELTPGMDVKYLYLGYEYYAAIQCEVGDSLVDGTGTEYIIAGVFKENQRMVDEKLINDFSVGEITYSKNVDKIIVCVDENVLSTGCWLGVDENYDTRDVIETVRKELADKGCSSRFMTFEELIDKGMADAGILYELINKIAIIVCLSAILMLVCVFIVVFVSEMKRFGIMYSLGFYLTDIKNIILIKNIIIVLTSVVLSNYIFKLFLYKKYQNADNEWLIYYLVGYHIYPKIIVGTIVFLLVVNCFIKWVLGNIVPADMLNERG